MQSRLPLAIVLVSASFVAACGSDAEPAYELELARPSLSIDSGDVAFTAPWSPVRVSRDPDPDSAAVVVRAIGTAEEPGLTRVIFELQDATHFPGYATWLTDRAPQRCGSTASDPQLSGTRFLVVEIEPAHLTGTPPPVVAGPLDSLGLKRMPLAALTCATGDRITWAAALGKVSEVRIQELRDPRRLAVEVR